MQNICEFLLPPLKILITIYLSIWCLFLRIFQRIGMTEVSINSYFCIFSLHVIILSFSFFPSHFPFLPFPFISHAVTPCPTCHFFFFTRQKICNAHFHYFHHPFFWHNRHFSSNSFLLDLDLWFLSCILFTYINIIIPSCSHIFTSMLNIYYLIWISNHFPPLHSSLSCLTLRVSIFA